MEERNKRTNKVKLASLTLKYSERALRGKPTVFPGGKIGTKGTMHENEPTKFPVMPSLKEITAARDYLRKVTQNTQVLFAAANTSEFYKALRIMTNVFSDEEKPIVLEMLNRLNAQLLEEFIDHCDHIIENIRQQGDETERALLRNTRLLPFARK